MRRGEYEAFYGGAAGGGKSDALLAEALRQVDIPHYRAVLFRKTYPELKDLIDRSYDLYRPAFPKARYNDSRHVWTFPSGAKIEFGNMQYTKDRKKYQGRRFDLISFDELTHFLWDEYSYMFSRNRPGGPGTRVYMRSAGNPGNIGHGWVKARFITAGKAMRPVTETIRVRFPDGHAEERERRRIFVPSRVFDNQKLLENDPDYMTNLAMMPAAERDALLYGSWDTFSGQVFIEWRNDPDHLEDRINTHVIAPFLVPQSWRVYRSLDWGYARPFSVGWYAVDHDNRLYRIRELYGCTGTPNEGVKMEPTAVARKIKEIENEDPNLKGRTVSGVADPSIWSESGNESIGALMERERVYFDRGTNARIDGKMQVHYRLSFDDEGIPMLYVFETCKHFIRTVPALVYDDKDVEDVDTDGEDHIYDELRYMCMLSPINRPDPKPKPLVTFDPLDLSEVKYDRYEFYRRL